jgi:hypothetical protein
LLPLNRFERVKLGLKNTFVTIPSNIYDGLRGDKTASFTDFLNIAKVPYYLGGPILALSFLAGKDKLSFARQGAGVGLYYAGVMVANAAINTLYRWRSGMDLNLRYRRSNGDIEKVFASAEFPRFDLLTDKEYGRMFRKMGVPQEVADPKKETNDQAKRIISTSRADKLILGNLIAALGAGYLARSDKFAHLLGGYGAEKTALTEGSLLKRPVNVARVFGGRLAEAFKDAAVDTRGKGLLGGMALATMALLAHCWFATRNNIYEPSFAPSPEEAGALPPGSASPVQTEIAPPIFSANANRFNTDLMGGVAQ